MLSFFRERKLSKLVQAHLDNFKSLPTLPSDPLQSEAVRNLYLDIIDSFSLLRDSFDFSQLITSTTDYRLARMSGMPGKVVRTVNKCLPIDASSLHSLPGKTQELASYFEQALFHKLCLDLCGESFEYSHERYISLLRLDAQLHNFGRFTIHIQPSEYYNLMESFARKQCLDIYIILKD